MSNLQTLHCVSKEEQLCIRKPADRSLPNRFVVLNPLSVSARYRAPEWSSHRQQHHGRTGRQMRIRLDLAGFRDDEGVFGKNIREGILSGCGVHAARQQRKGRALRDQIRPLRHEEVQRAEWSEHIDHGHRFFPPDFHHQSRSRVSTQLLLHGSYEDHRPAAGCQHVDDQNNHSTNTDASVQILSGGPAGTPVRYARIGDHVYHKWSCMTETDDIYCMRVHTCTVYDGQGGEAVTVLDKNGCEVDRFVLQNLEYSHDLMAGQEAHVFKFADRPALYFNCQIALTIKDRQYGCNIAPKCDAATINREPVGMTPAPPMAVKNTNHEYAQRPLPTARFETHANRTNPAYAKYESGYTTTTATPYQQTQVYPSAQENIYDDIATSTKKRTASTRGPPGYRPPPQYTDSVDYQDFSDVSEDFDRNTQSPSQYNDETDVAARPYKKKIFVRRDTSSARDTHKIADFDLPEQSFLVFGIEDGPVSDSSGVLSELNSDYHSDCITMSRLMITLGLLVGVASVLLIFSVVIIRRQRVLLNKRFLKC
ncbi:hypothetical protein L596_002657 [Steinernema carpocapsae]|uniref:ZP domain-containing protein n=1 Tax=Steinernema carpocapsae TaxID=34508 RepID=A0A4U8USR8_STECR|nr:hypothetical protein L596_002657 [Steinernema carpocapsae]